VATLIAVDANVVIASLLNWHEFYDRAAAALEHLDGETLLLPQPVLFEAYSVMTRFPSPQRVLPAVALDMLAVSFGDVRIVAMPAQRTWDLLQRSVAEGITGGRIYDAVIANIAIEAGARELLTFNARHFETFADRITIRVP